MNWKRCHVFLVIFLVSCLVAVISPFAGATVPDKTTTNVDLVQYGGSAGSVVVSLVNMTPYTIKYDYVDNNNQLQDQTDQNRNTKKSFMFAPVGIPGAGSSPIPGVPVDSDGNPVSPNNTTHPFNFILSWDDQNALVENSSIFWTVQNVSYTTSTGAASTKDVTVGLWFNRQNPDKNLFSSFFAGLVSVLKVGLEFAAVIEDGGEGIIPWVCALLATEEFAEGTVEFAEENTQEDNGPKMYLSAMAVPTGICAQGIGQGCSPSYWNMSDPYDGDELPDDAVATQWATADGGYDGSELVVTLQLLRGSMAGNSYLGTIPIATITVWTQEWFLASQLASLTQSKMEVCPGGRKIYSLLKKWKRPGWLQLAQLIRKYDPRRKQLLSQIVQALQAKRPLTGNQKAFLTDLAAALHHDTNFHPPQTPPKGSTTFPQGRESRNIEQTQMLSTGGTTNVR
ncbi:MAG: hypothetical protein ABFD75_03870 [Smithella sp.]